MTLELTPIEPGRLPPAVRRVASPDAPAPARMMAAKGLAPMGPAELVTAIYQLARDPDARVAKAAGETAGKLPDKILLAAIGEPLDPRVLHFFAPKLLDRPPLVEKLLLNPRTADETVLAIAGRLDEAGVELVASNQQRLLRCPAIIEEVYHNPRARMSTVDRMLELAVRNGVELARVPQFKALAAAILGTARGPAAESIGDFRVADEVADQAFSAALDAYAAEPEHVDLEVEEDEGEGEGGELDTSKPTAIAQLPIHHKIRLAVLGNQSHRAQLIRDPNKLVAMAAISSPKVTEQEATKHAANRGLPEEVVRYIANKREWLKSYAIKVALVNNPKCPIAHAMRFLNHLRPNDLRAISRSKNVPAPVAKAAKQLIKRKL